MSADASIEPARPSWTDEEGLQRPLHVSVDEELRGIFAEARALDRRPSGTMSVRAATAGPSGEMSLVTWMGLIVGLVLVAVAVISLAAPRAPARDPSGPQLAAESPGLVPDPQPMVQAAPVIAAPPLAASSVTRPPRAARATTPRRTLAHTGGCSRYGGDALARCLWPEVMRADAELRRAYDRAVRAGVPRDRLASTRDRWSSLRGQARRDPVRVVAAYRQMAAALERARGRTRQG